MNAPAWSEASLRAAASWQAFKEGTRLAPAATVAASGPDGYRGTVRTGGRAHQTRVTVRSPSHLEVRCSCPENQATGAVCAHAVALGLAALRATAAPVAPPERAPAPAAAAAAEPAPAWCVEFPPNWQEALAKGRLAPVLRHATSPSAEAVPHDRPLTAWLRAAGCAPEKSPQHLHLGGDRLREFLDLLPDHPRVATRSGPLAITTNGRLPLRSLTLGDDTVRLIVDDNPAIIRCGGTLWWHEPGQLVRLHPAAATLPRQLPLARFLEQIDAFQEAFTLPDDCFVRRLRFVPAPFTALLHLDGQLQALRATLAIRYGDRHTPLAPGQPGDTGLPRLERSDLCLVRDSEGEDAAARMLVRAGFQPPSTAADGWRLTDPDAVIRFLTQTLPALKSVWTVTESAALAKARAGLTTVRPAISIISSGEDWLEFDLSFEADDGRVFSHADVQRLLRSGKGAAASRTIVSSDVGELLEPLLAELDLRQENGRFTAKRLAAAVIEEFAKNRGKALIESHLDVAEDAHFPAVIRAVPRPYQQQGVAWLNDRLKRYSGALLADDMGLGKTLQTIALIELMAAQAGDRQGLVLVVVPTSLLGNWADEFARFAPGRVVHRLHGVGRDALRERVVPGAVVLTSFATLPRDLAWHLRQAYDLVVVDEASQMRNPDTDHAKALCKLNARHRLALSGTPVENSVRDLWSIFRFLLPSWLGERSEFRERYEVPLAATPPDPAVLARLRMKTAPFVLRRTKAQVAPELPAKLVIDEFCDLSAQQRAAYQQLLAEGRRRVEEAEPGSGAARMHLLTALLRLRQTCCDLALIGGERARRLDLARRSAKLERLLELLATALSEGSKVLVFSQFRAQLREIEEQVAARGWRSLRLDGQTANRREVVARFQAADGPPVFLISLKAGGYGLNLTAADTVIHFDPWWNPAVEAQATDRAHRIGQTRPVTVYRLLARGTVEEKVLRLQARKRDVAALIDETGEGDSSGMAEADLRALLDEA